MACVAISLVMATGANAAPSNSSLNWGRPKLSQRANIKSTERAPSAQPARNPLRPRMVRDSQVIATVWDETETAGVRQTAGEHQSIVVERTSPIHGTPNSNPASYDPFDEDDRLAQLPNDPFDDPFDEPEGESIPAPEPEENLEDAAEAIEGEIQRRRSASDLLDQEMEDSLDPEIPEADPVEDLGDDDLLSDNPEDEDQDLLQSEDEDFRTPDFDLDLDEDQELTPEELRERSEQFQRERERNVENCREELSEVEADTISSIDLSIRIDGDAGEDYPYECPVSSGSHQPRQWCEITYNWKAAAICHKPLYFEQVQLERYGHSWGPFVQPIMSGAHFFGTIPILPYKMGIRTPRECVYTLGYYRPGSCAPYMIDPIPFTWRAAMFQAGAVTGTSFVVP